MQCVTPMFYKYELGKPKEGKIIPRTEILHELNYDPNYIRKQIKIWNVKNPRYKIKQVPCNHCYACSLKYSQEIATLAMCECKKSEHNYFITLTYDKEHLPFKKELKIKEKGTDNIITYFNNEELKPTLIPEHMHTFIHNLRQYMERTKDHKGIKYIYCGEYGETTQRPHYHLILMNCPLNIEDFYDFHVDKNFKAHWKSKEIENYWDKGMIDIAECEWSSVAYVARYTAKKVAANYDKQKMYSECRIPEFLRRSTKLGEEYYKENKDKIYKTDEIIMKTVKGNIGNAKPPRYFDKLYEKEHPREMTLIKLSREKEHMRKEQAQQALTDATDKQMMIMQMQNVAKKMSMLKRTEEI